MPAAADTPARAAKESGGILFELGMSSSIPRSLDDVTMTLSLYNATTGRLITPDELLVKISKTDTALFPPTSFKAQKDSVAIFRYTFPEGGNYAIGFSASKSDTRANATFEFFVQRSENETTSNPIIIIVGIVAVILVLTPFFIRFVSGF
ncbi:MAG: hypothetical protein HYS53_01695 [Candidatus Aenigmarchaeota archaeon]|nr:hypothetical protein [Candidatus Aenigmarchaeota archaeon]